MSLVVNNNIASLIAQRNLTNNSNGVTASIERLSSGYKINKASDDAAGLSISEGLKGQINGNEKAMGNIQDGINMLQIAEGSLQSISESCQRIRELCVQGANDTNGENEKNAIITEINARLEDINRISKSTVFNGIDLFSENNEEFEADGTTENTAYSPLKLQIGAGSNQETNVLNVANVLNRAEVSQIGFGLTQFETDGTGASTDTEIVGSMFTDGKLQVDTNDTVDGFQSGDATGANWSSDNILFFMDKVDSVIDTIVTRRSNIGAYQNRLETALNNLTITNENLTASESRIRDVDIAEETASLTKYQILQQASASVLAQANQVPQLALSLLAG